MVDANRSPGSRESTYTSARARMLRGQLRTQNGQPSSFHSALNPSDEELRKSIALVCHDALKWTKPLPERAQSVLMAAMLRLAISKPLTVDDERDVQRELLKAGARLTGPYSGQFGQEQQP